ncbi:hypothetical protein SAY86_003763 [Trapa natans]|uniref:BHLH domain-containing protein n=1 Tax=Trapa natans TaxID=22666 RepID=A0AAN7N2E8_TRANT|nr:hypothetical protein SAY86_003763 [Trapa natans]
MVKGGDSWVFHYHPAWKPPDLNGTGSKFKPIKQESVSPDSPFYPSFARRPGCTVTGIPNPSFHHVQAFPSCLNLFQKNAPLPSHESCQENPTLGSLGQRFFVFDQSEKGTRLIYGSSSHLFQESEILRMKTCDDFPVFKGKYPSNSVQFGLYNSIFREESGENDIDGEENDIHENSEEINALLYSEDDVDDHEEGEYEEDEVTSTGHSSSVLVQCCGRHNKVENTLEVISNFSHLNKRQKLITSRYNCSNSLHMDMPLTKLDGSCRPGSDADLSFMKSQAREEDKFPLFDGDLCRKDMIRDKMKILEGIVPGAEGMDPVVILEKAIEYLKTLKLKAEVLGMSYH